MNLIQDSYHTSFLSFFSSLSFSLPPNIFSLFLASSFFHLLKNKKQCYQNSMWCLSGNCFNKVQYFHLIWITMWLQWETVTTLQMPYTQNKLKKLSSSHSTVTFPLQTQISPKKVKDVVNIHSGAESIVSNILTLIHKQPINNNQLTKRTHLWTVGGRQSTRRHRKAPADQDVWTNAPLCHPQIK